MDRGAWWAIVHKVAKSRTLVKQLSMRVCYIFFVPVLLHYCAMLSCSVVSNSLRPNGQYVACIPPLLCSFVLN